ncbi:phasin family protein [Ferruginivarius sediminum]|nr:phasin family protein [Ferruginivarius sediminum]
MATQSQEKTPSAAAFNKMFEGFGDDFGTNFDSLMKANAKAGQVWMEQCSKISRELMEFTNNRWSKDVEAFRELSECRDPFQAFQVQANCVQSAMKQYIDEAAKLTDMATDASVSCFKSIDEGVRSATSSGEESGRKAA